MDDLIEIRYAGMVVAKSASIRDRDAAGFFISVNDPMPVGTYVSLKINDQPKNEQPNYARVEQVVESTDATLVGMRLRFVDSLPARASAPVPARPLPVEPSAPVAAPAVSPAAAAPVADVTPADDETGVTETEIAGGEVAGGGAGEAAPASAGGNGGGRRRRRRR